MRHLKTYAILLYVVAAACTQQSQTIYQWHGPNRDGIYPEKNLLKTWPESGPEMLWLAEGIGHGYSAPVIADNQLFINGEKDSISHVFAFDLKGKLLWKSPNGKEFFGKGYSATYPGSRSTPTVYDNLVYVCSGLGRIACFEATSGKERWAVEMVRDLGGRFNAFGFSESLLVDEKYAYCTPGGEESNITALDRLTGKVVWTSKAMSDLPSYISPVIINLPERKILLTLSREYLFGLDIRNGALLWSHKVDSVKWDGDHCNTPLYSDGFIYSSTGEDNGNGLYKLALSPDGKSIKEIWRNRDVKNYFWGFVKINERLYCTSHNKKMLSVDIHTGTVVDSLSNLRGGIIYADDRLYCYSDNGSMNLIDPTDSRMKVVSKFKIEKGTQQHFAHPVIANGVLYIRHGDALMAYQIK